MRRAIVLLFAALACSKQEKIEPVRVKPHKVEMFHAAAGDVAREVAKERAQAKEQGRTLVVYIGATWCEPCQRFHKAAQAGELDKELGALTLMEFDLDQDQDRLKAAGYAPHYIPYFGLPGDDGRPVNSFEGSIKGEGAVSDITPKLHDLTGL